MTLGVGLAAIVAIVAIAELGRALVAKLFGYQAERHAIPIMKLPGSRGSTGFRLALILAGPVAAYLAVSTLAFLHVRSAGIWSPETARVIGGTVEGTDAAGKLSTGDLLLEVDGHAFPGSTAELAAQVNAREGAAITLTVERAGATQTVTIQPTQDPEGRWRLGVRLDARDHRTSSAFAHALRYPIDTTGAIVSGLVAVFAGSEDVEAGGPIRIAKEFETASERSTFETVIGLGMLFGVYALLALALFDLVRALLLILFRG